MSSHIEANEFRVMRDYIEKHCGIHLGEEKRYLVEARLTTIMVENGCRTFTEFYHKALADATRTLRDKIIDAMTTNETLWFRDAIPFVILEEVLLRQYATEIARGVRRTIRIWCAACSTGQEPYSTAITVFEMARKGFGIKPEQVEIIASDISPTALFLAKNGRYDGLAISRGMPDDLRDRYFRPEGKIWQLSENVRKMVAFKRFNLQDDFSALGHLDLVFCRNVLIYFSDDFKRDVIRRIAQALRPGGYFFLGASESVSLYSTEFTMLNHPRGLYYQVK